MHVAEHRDGLAGGQRMALTVIGTGYLGLTHAVCMADLGHDVLAMDTDENRIATAARAEAPFFEPGLQPLLRKNIDAGRLRFTTSAAAAADFGPRPAGPSRWPGIRSSCARAWPCRTACPLTAWSSA